MIELILLTVIIVLLPPAAMGSFMIYMMMLHGSQGLNGFKFGNAWFRTGHNPKSTLKPEVFSQLTKDFNGNDN